MISYDDFLQTVTPEQAVGSSAARVADWLRKNR